MAGWPPKFETVIRAHCRLLPAGAEIASDRLLTDLGVDSLQVVELIVALEDAFDVTLPQRILTPEVFATPASIWTALSPIVAERHSHTPG